MDNLNRWTIHLSKIPIVEVQVPVPAREGTYMVSAVKMNGVPVRCMQASIVMSPTAPVSLHLKIMPRDLEIIMEGDDGDQEKGE